MNKFFGFIRLNFFSGLIIFVPFILTIYLVLETGKWLNSFVGLTPARFIQLPPSTAPLLSELILFIIALCFFVLIITIFGLATKNLLGKVLVGFGEKTISKIPLANAGFTTTKQISKIIFTEGEKEKNVVLVEYPRVGVYCLGFVTQNIESQGMDKLPVFIPTSPNPSSGFLVFFKNEDIKRLDISADDAFKLILSGGLALNDQGFASKFKF